MSRNTVPNRLIDQAGQELRGSVLFAAGVVWQPGDTVMLAPTERYRVLERRDGEPVVLVVEPADPLHRLPSGLGLILLGVLSPSV